MEAGRLGLFHAVPYDSLKTGVQPRTGVTLAIAAYTQPGAAYFGRSSL